MPTWGIHLAIAKKLNDKIKYNTQDKNAFIIGNLAPDILNGNGVENISHLLTHEKTHYQIRVQIKNHTEKRYDIEEFLKQYKSKLSNPLILGYYSHLLSDKFWNCVTYEEKGIYNDEKIAIGFKRYDGKELYFEKPQLRKVKISDFKNFSKYIVKNKLLDIPKYDEKILEYAKEMELINLQKQDVLQTIEYVEKFATFKEEIKPEKDEYQIYSEDEMKQNLVRCVNFILEKINI